MTPNGVVAIGWPQLLLAAGFMLITGALSLAIGLGLVKDLAVASVRTYVQLLALGVVLRWVFAVRLWWVVVLLLGFMTVVATRIVVKRAPDAPRGLFSPALFSMVVTAITVTFAVTALIVRVPVWYEPRYVIPIAGMVLGNSMTGIALSLERLFSDLDARSGEILALTALGADRWEAARASVRLALRAGLIPTINSMAAAGIVFIPGMMTGQVLAGADPLEATKYQIVVMLMISAATAIGSILAVMLSYRRAFTAEGVFLEKGLRGPAA
ncbi:MAG: iron export ABC transporter permease subunit FetB [Actinomycetia bacterium]|nr:iron export ABC transporter permease subunit FetB [Actinomycetes bacterium]